MRRGWWAAGLAALALLGAAAPATAGTYDVVSCGAPGANGVNRAWEVIPGFDDRFWDIAPSCPELSAWSERRPGVVAPNFTGAGFQLSAPPGAMLDRMVIWRTGYRFNSTGSAQGPWAVQGYRADGSVLGGPLTGETCLIEAGQLACRFGAEGAMAPGARIERDLETTRVLYSAACFDPPGCSTANDQGFPFAGLSISGSIVTVRDTVRPAVVARGALLAPGWRTEDLPLSFGASDAVGIRVARVLVDGAEVLAVRPKCDFTAMAPCGQVGERSARLGDRLPDGRRTVSVEATDTAGNVTRANRAVDRSPPALAFLPSSGGRRIAVAATDAGAGVTGGTIEARGRRQSAFRPLPTSLRGGRLVARLARGSRRSTTLRVTAIDAVGQRATITGAPVRLRAGFGRRLRSATRAGRSGSVLVQGRLRAGDGAPLPGRAIAVQQRPRVDGAALRPVGTVTTGRRGTFRIRVPAGASRVVRVTSPGTGGLQAALRKLRLRVPWSSSLTIRPRSTRRGGTIRLSGRLRLGRAVLPPSGKLVEVQAFDRGRWRVFATTRARGARAAWRTSYRFGSRAAGTYRIRARIRREGTLPYELGYSRPARVTVF
jgi:hypothetical protein